MKLIVNFLILCFVIGFVVMALKFVLSAIGIGLSAIWHCLPLLVIGGIVWLVMKSRR